MTTLAVVLFAGFWVGVIFFTLYYGEDRIPPERHPPLPEFEPRPSSPVDDTPDAP
jgi:hypothetical protein